LGGRAIIIYIFFALEASRKNEDHHSAFEIPAQIRPLKMGAVSLISVNARP